MANGQRLVDFVGALLQGLFDEHVARHFRHHVQHPLVVYAALAQRLDHARTCTIGRHAGALEPAGGAGNRTAHAVTHSAAYFICW